MKKLIVACLLLLATATAYAENQGDGSLLYRGTYVQGWSPNGLYSAALSSGASVTYDLTNFLAYSVYCSSDCSVRLTPTAAKGSYPQVTIPSGSWYTAVKNTATPFVNVSSGSGGHQWQQQ